MGIGNPGPGLGQAQKSGWIKSVCFINFNQINRL